MNQVRVLRGQTATTSIPTPFRTQRGISLGSIQEGFFGPMTPLRMTTYGLPVEIVGAPTKMGPVAQAFRPEGFCCGSFIAVDGKSLAPEEVNCRVAA